MITGNILELVAREQALEPLPSDMVMREKLTEVKAFGSLALIVKGIRRCGKSTLLKQKLLNKPHHAFNFDDERLGGFVASDFQLLMQVLMRLNGNQKTILLDEIQNITGWELFVNRLLRQGYQILITGSNADLLSKELGTHLTGRHYDIELWPFSFKEYLLFKKIPIPVSVPTTSESAELERAFSIYIYNGGIPEAVRENSNKILPVIVEDIIRKDIIRRYSIRKQEELRNILKMVIANTSNRFTFRSLSNNFGIKNHITVQRYLSYACDAYLIFLVEKYDKKLKRTQKNPKKVYCSDTGIAAVFSPLLEQRGALLENIVALELKRRKKLIFFYVNKNNSETDFVVVGKDKKIVSAIQVCHDLSSIGTRKREQGALLSTLSEIGLREGLIITLGYDETINFKGKKIRYVPVWKWLLGL